MLHLIATIALLNLMACMSPGPDFAIVTKNTLLYSRQAGLATSLGVATAVLIHATYCSLGLALIIVHSTTAFTLIKYIGGIYLIYTGLNSWNTHAPDKPVVSLMKSKTTNCRKAFKDGLITNLTNPKCMLFLLALFSMVIRDTVSPSASLLIILTFFTITLTWFSLLTWMMTHKIIEPYLKRWQNILIKITSVSLVGFGFSLFFVST
jgi:RhtB (resistance to homoserine/threonine) family protein